MLEVLQLSSSDELFFLAPGHSSGLSAIAVISNLISGLLHTDPALLLPDYPLSLTYGT